LSIMSDLELPAEDWYRRFFTELPNEFWRQAAPPASATPDVDFVERRLGLRPGARVLDVPCGSGRHSLELARRGYQVTGVDVSPEAIEHARAAAADAGLDVRLVCDEMRAIPQEGEFDAAICLGNCLGYLDIAGLREFAAALAGAVRPGGGLVVDYNATAESILPGYTGEPSTHTTGPITMDATHEYDVIGGRLLSRYRFTRGNETLDATAVHHVHTCAHVVSPGVPIVTGPALPSLPCS
jgi:2-polyprenyl-3-methyl-5-hydroxy-6-metoxy-1,4-benzoquinol methylase